MQRAASYPSVPEQPRTLAIAGSLLLVSLSYVLLLAAPVITRHFGTLAVGQVGLKTLESWLPLACGAGLVLGGASALVFVLTQITREAQRRPYVSLAPVLAAFSACVLIGLRAELPLPGVSSEHIAVFAVAVAVVGGSLVQMPRVSAQLLGMACTFLPPASLFGVLWVLSGSADPARAVWGLPSTARAFLGMLTLSCFAIGALATLARRAEAAGEVGSSARVLTEVSPRVEPRAAHASAFGSRAQPRALAPSDYTPLELEQSLLADEALLARRGLPGWVIAMLAGAVLGLSFMAFRMYMERRAATAFLERQEVRGAVAAQPAAEPQAPEALLPASAAPSQQPQNVEPEPSKAPALGLPVAPAGDAARAARAPGESGREQARAEPAAQSLGAVVVTANEEHHSGAGGSKTRVSHRAAREARAHKAAPEARLEPKPAVVEAKASKSVEARGSARQQNKAEREDDSASVALKAARAATKAEAKPAAHVEARGSAREQANAETKPAAPSPRGDESLDELMDNVLKPAKGGAKKRDMQASEDPIYGL